MEIWNVLGIEPTKDKNEIKNAYRKKLMVTNPEDNPEGFKELRAAFEEANNYADLSDEDIAKLEETATYPDTPEGRFLYMLDELYKNFYDRISVEKWQQLLNCDFCVALDTTETAFFDLLKFLMNHIYLPGEIFRLITDTYSIEERRSELEEKFPPDFLEFVINNGVYPDIIDFSLFFGDEDADYDSYIEKFFSLDNAVRNRKLDEQKNLIEALSECDIYNPYLDVLRVRNYLQNDENDKAKELIDNLSERYPENNKVLICKGDVYSILEQNDVVSECYEKCLKLNPDDFVAKAKMAEFNLLTGKYGEARDAFIELMKISHYDNTIRAGMIKANEGLIKNNLEKIDKLNTEEDIKEINKVKMELGWSYYQSYMFTEAVKVLESFSPDGETIFEYNNVLGRSLLCVGEYEKALSCFRIWEAAIESLDKADESEETKKKKVRIQYVKFLIGSCYVKLNKLEEGKKYIDIALSKEHDEYLLASEAKCEVEYKLGNYTQCIEACDNLEVRDRRNYIASEFRAKSFFELGMYQQAFNFCEKAIQIYPYIIEPYEIQMKMFLNIKEYDNVLKTIERYRSMGVNSDTCIMYEARICRIKDNDYKKAISLLENVLPHLDKDDESDIEERDFFCLLLGDCYEKEKMYKEALSMYQKAFLENPENRYVHEVIAQTYKMMGNVDAAIDEYDKQIEKNARSYDYLNRGVLYRYKHEYEKAASDYEKAIQMDDSDYVYYKYAAVNYINLKQLDKALICYEKALSLVDEGKDKIFLKHKLAGVYKAQHEYKKAEELYVELMDESNRDSDIVLGYAFLLSEMGRFSEAEHYLKELLTENKISKAYISERLAALAKKQEDFSKMKEIINYAVKNNCVSADLLFQYAMLLMQAEKYQKAEDVLLKSVELDRKKENNLYSLLAEAASHQYGSKARVKRYLDALRKTISNPVTPVDYIMLARGLRVEKKYEEALQYIQKAIALPLCNDCVLCACGDAYEELGMIYECMQENEKAVYAYEKAIFIYGSIKWYERKIKRLKK